MTCCSCCLPHAVIPRPIGLGSEQTYLRAVQELQHLTRLELTLSIADDREPEICSYLSGLVNLQHLQLWFMEGEPRYQDCLSLCRLKSLTHLSLHRAEQAVGDTVAVALASSLPLLRHLELSWCQISCDTVIPAMAMLQHLTQLVLPYNGIAYVAGCVDLIKQLRDPNWPKLVVKL